MSQKEQIMTLTIKRLEEKDTDLYTCDVGTAKSMAKVTVNGKYICMDLLLGSICTCHSSHNNACIVSALITSLQRYSSLHRPSLRMT